MALPPLDPVIHQATRLRIMALLSRAQDAPFTYIRDTLGLTDGNLGKHAGRLERVEYIQLRTVLTPGGFRVWFRLTSKGVAAFRSYRQAILAYFQRRPPP